MGANLKKFAIILNFYRPVGAIHQYNFLKNCEYKCTHSNNRPTNERLKICAAADYLRQLKICNSYFYRQKGKSHNDFSTMSNYTKNIAAPKTPTRECNCENSCNSCRTDASDTLKGTSGTLAVAKGVVCLPVC